MNKSGNKAAVIGTGNVGSTVAYTLLLSGLISEIVMIDYFHEKALGEAMDIGHCVPLFPAALIYAGEYSDLKGADIVIISAGVGQRDGETRIQLLQRNREVFASIIPNIVQYAPDSTLLIVSNPVDILSEITLELSGFPPERVIGSGTVLDTSRLRYRLSQVARVDASNVHSYVLGEHGDTEFVAWSLTNVAGMSFDDFCNVNGVVFPMGGRESIEDEVRNAAYEIIKRKGSTYYAVAAAVMRIVRAILRDEHSILTVSTNVRKKYGELPDVYLSLPCVVGGAGILRIIDAPLCEDEQEKLYHSARTLEGVLQSMRMEGRTTT